jgi:hypothetical protein
MKKETQHGTASVTENRIKDERMKKLQLDEKDKG